MPALDERVTIANEALSMIGGADIASFDEESDDAKAALRVYNRVVGVCFDHPYRWRSAQQTFALAQLADAPLNGWAYAFARPGTAIGTAVRIMADPKRPESPLRRFADEAGNIYADLRPLWGTWVVATDPTLWRPSFRDLVVTAMAAELAIPIAHDVKLAGDLALVAWGSAQENRAGGKCRVAINADVSGAPVIATPVDPDPFAMARS